MSLSSETRAERAERASLAALRPLLPYALVYRGRVLGAFFALMLASGATLVVPVAVRRMIDYGFSADQPGLIDAYFGALIAVVALLALASGLRYYFVMTLGELVVAKLRGDVFAYLTSLDASFYDAEKTGEIVSRLSADTTQLKSAFGSSASIALRNFFMFFGAAAMMVVTSPKLSAYVLIAIPFIILPLYAAGRSVRTRARAAQDTLADATAFATESLSAVRVMQAFVAEAASIARFRAAVWSAYEAARATTTTRAFVTIAAIFLAFASVVVVLWLGAQDVLSHLMTGGALSQFLLFAVLAAGALGELSQVWSEVSAAAGAAGRIAELLAVEPKIASPSKPATLPVPPQGRIVFDRVAFAYPTRPDERVLKGLDLSVAPGEVVALVGPSGAGKSTIFQLAMRFYDPSDGAVSFDGLDIRTVDPAGLRRRIAFVPQEPVIFGTTIAENIAYGAPGADLGAIRAAASRAAADGFIAALPQGYHTTVGERGVTLSGGERQRIAIARAILKDAPVLLLDEATSALDAENETLVQKALESLMAGRTTLVIAHRLATVVHADRILTIEAGRIVEEGTHQTLLAQGGLYARLARLQFEAGAAALEDGRKAAE
ncbi:MAG TPA: ABC transporter transmembrane domain-containing protein [Roseiarcus sp.]|nr:ABC transporter transmembrane domain-containing protein [Roseiarcus sp.]